MAHSPSPTDPSRSAVNAFTCHPFKGHKHATLEEANECWDKAHRTSRPPPGIGGTLFFVWKRDRGICWLCGKTVRLRTSPRSPIRPTLDHIIPKSRGGEDKCRNYRLAHQECNVARGNLDADLPQFTAVKP